jgi:hypothetical protein
MLKAVVFELLAVARQVIPQPAISCQTTKSNF